MLSFCYWIFRERRPACDSKSHSSRLPRQHGEHPQLVRQRHRFVEREQHQVPRLLRSFAAESEKVLQTSNLSKVLGQSSFWSTGTSCRARSQHDGLRKPFLHLACGSRRSLQWAGSREGLLRRPLPLLLLRRHGQLSVLASQVCSAGQRESDSRHQPDHRLQSSRLFHFVLRHRVVARGRRELRRMSELFHVLQSRVSDQRTAERRAWRDLPVHPVFPAHFRPRTSASDQHVFHVHFRAGESILNLNSFYIKFKQLQIIFG